MRKFKFIIFIVIIGLILTACGSIKGRIIIKENISGTEIEISISKWSEQNHIHQHYEKGEEVQVSIKCESGNVAIEFLSINGVKAYSGNELSSCFFTVTIPETNDYTIRLKGNSASGKIELKIV